MGQKITIPIGGGSYEDEALQLSSQKVVNMYVETPQVPTISDVVLKGTPGIDLVLEVSTDVFRGSVVMNGVPYFVLGGVLYCLNRSGTAPNYTFSVTEHGALPVDGLVSMATNGTQVVIVIPGDSAYAYTEADGLVEITDANFDGPADWVEYISGYFLFGVTSGKKVINSPVNDARGLPNGTAYDALDFFTAEADPDDIRGAVNLNDRLYVLGTQTTQAYQLTDRVPAPFVPIKGAVFPKGLSADFSIVKTQNSFAMIGAGENESPAIWEFTGNGYRKLSHAAIEQTLADLDTEALGEIAAWSYAKNGAFQVGFTLSDTALVYNQASGRWTNQESTFFEVDGTYRALGMVTAYGEVICFDNRTGLVGKLNQNTYKEYGELIKRKLITRPFDNVGENLSVAEIEVVCQVGIGNSDVAEPIMRVSKSEDGGMTYGPEYQMSLGKVGEYWRRPKIARFGQIERARTLMFEFSDPAPLTIAKVEAEVG